MGHFVCSKNDEYHRQLFDRGEERCPLCGEELTNKNTQLKMKKCPECKARMPVDRERCSGCGFIFNPDKRKVGDKKRGRRAKVAFTQEY